MEGTVVFYRSPLKFVRIILRWLARPGDQSNIFQTVEWTLFSRHRFGSLYIVSPRMNRPYKLSLCIASFVPSGGSVNSTARGKLCGAPVVNGEASDRREIRIYKCTGLRSSNKFISTPFSSPDASPEELSSKTIAAGKGFDRRARDAPSE